MLRKRIDDMVDLSVLDLSLYQDKSWDRLEFDYINHNFDVYRKDKVGEMNRELDELKENQCIAINGYVDYYIATRITKGKEISLVVMDNIHNDDEGIIFEYKLKS